MGKRELLLAAAFILVGFVVYQVTAPPPDPTERGFSLSRIIDNVRREVRGQNETAEATHALTRPLPDTIQEIRIRIPVGGMTITGEDRADIDADLHVRSNGFDKAEAEQRAKATTLKFDEAGPVLIIAVDAPTEGRQRPTLRLKIPSRLGVRIDEKNGELTITNVALVSMGITRGATTISTVAGAVSATQRGSTITISDVGSLKLTTNAGADARVSNVRGDVTLSLQTGELRAEGLAGALEVEARAAEMHFEKLDGLTGPVRVNANLGEVVIVGLRTDTRIDGRQTEIRVDQAAPAPLAIYNDGTEPLEVTVPTGGFKLDALAVNGRITLDAALEKEGLRVEAPDEGTVPPPPRREARVLGVVAGGGPTITLRATRGEIVLKRK
ncbi:MAG: hypothetical protein WD227_03475 [Vicinamibacterales bacterium]